MIAVPHALHLAKDPPVDFVEVLKLVDDERQGRMDRIGHDNLEELAEPLNSPENRLRDDLLGLFLENGAQIFLGPLRNKKVEVRRSAIVQCLLQKFRFADTSASRNDGEPRRFKGCFPNPPQFP